MQAQVTGGKVGAKSNYTAAAWEGHLDRKKTNKNKLKAERKKAANALAAPPPAPAKSLQEKWSVARNRGLPGVRPTPPYSRQQICQ